MNNERRERTGRTRTNKTGRTGRANTTAEKKQKPVYTAVYKVNHSAELLEYLLLKCNTSRNNVKSLLTNHQVLVNGSVVTQYNFPLAKDDEVKLSKTPVRGEARKMPVGEKRKAIRPQLKIIYEDDDFIAIDKPAGLLSVESDKDTECAYSYVLDYLQRKDKSVRPFILHRIDKETSGVLIFAKNIKLHSMLRLNWNDYIRAREYYAVTEGKFEKKEDTVVSYLRENKNNLMYSTHDPSGQKAITHYKVIKENGQYTLLAVKIDTGRKNQIRVQMQAIGHPVVGDDKYGQPKDPLRRLGLHASALEFEHPKTKQIIRIEAPMPASFGNLF
jgi:23S rRNA pseudouridine1911/1915/1917 synthase